MGHMETKEGSIHNIIITTQFPSQLLIVLHDENLIGKEQYVIVAQTCNRHYLVTRSSKSQTEKQHGNSDGEQQQPQACVIDTPTRVQPILVVLDRLCFPASL